MRPFARAWVKSSSQSWRALPVPTDAPIVHASGADADRVLLIGNGLAVGYGVLSHDLGLAGHLARRLTDLTGRGTSVDVRPNPDMTATDARDILAVERVEKYDAIVSTLGGIEAVQLHSLSTWRRDVESFLAAIRAVAPDTSVHFVGVPLSSSMVQMPHFYGALVERHTRRLNAITQEVCERNPNCAFIAFEPTRSRIVDDISRQLYQNWADLIALPIASALDEHVHNDVTVEDESDRMATLELLGILESPRDDDLEQIVATVRDLFGASGAGVNIIDRTRLWVMAAAGMSREDTPREESVCTRTIASTDLLVVEDTHKNPVYSLRAWAHGEEPIRFYAGYPIEAPDGHRIGALCVVDSKPRSFSATDRALLRELAMQVQGLLWKKHRTLSRQS